MLEPDTIAPERRTGITLPPLDAVFPAVAKALDRDGFAAIENVVTPVWLDRARAQVEQEIAGHGQKFFSLICPAQQPGSIFAEVTDDPALQQLLQRLVEHACPTAAIEPGGPYNVLRVIAGKTGEDGAFQFHYDSSVITVVVPILIPENPHGPAGQLAVFPNKRPIRCSVAANIAEKALLQNRFAWRRAKDQVNGNPSAHLKQLIPGNIYLFWGYRTYHGNLPCGVEALRATLLLHLGDPHRNGLVSRAIRLARAKIEARRRRA